MKQSMGMGMYRHHGRSEGPPPNRGPQIRAHLISHWEMDFHWSGGVGIQVTPDIHSSDFYHGMFWYDASPIDFVSGKLVWAANFDEGDQMSTYLGGIEAFPRGAFSMCGWFKLESDLTGLGHDGMRMVGRKGDFHFVVGPGVAMFIVKVATYQPYPVISWGWLSMAKTWDTNWHFFVIGYRPASKIYLQIDGASSVAQASLDIEKDPYRPECTEPVMLGGWDEDDEAFSEADIVGYDGLLDEISLFETCLGPSTGNYLYNDGAGRKYPWDSGVVMQEDTYGTSHILTEDGKYIKTE